MIDEMAPLKSADGCLASEVLVSSLFLFYIPVSLLKRPRQVRLLLSLSVKDFDRKGNLTLAMGQRWRREQEDSGACIPSTLLRKEESCCAICFVSDKLAVCLPPVQLAEVLMNLLALRYRLISLQY